MATQKMTDQFVDANKMVPITPTPELIRQWNEEAATAPMADQRYIAIQAAQWGADQELEACCEWLDIPNNRSDRGDGWLMPGRLRAARRPKPPSLAKQALDAWDRLRGEAWCEEIDFDVNRVRRALERLQELEQN